MSGHRIDQLLSRLTRALVLGSNAACIAAPPEPLAWPKDLPALPEELERALRWRRATKTQHHALCLPTLVLSRWQDLAERMRHPRPPGQFPLSEYTLLEADGRVSWCGDPVADSLADLIELEALIHELLPNSRVRRLRVDGPLSDWQRAESVEPEPGTVWAVESEGYWHYAVQLAPRLWVRGTTALRPEQDTLLSRVRSDLHAEEVYMDHALVGEPLWRASLQVWTRPPLQELLQRLPPLPPLLRSATPPPPPSLQALWDHLETELTDGHEALRQMDLIPLVRDDLDVLCLDTRGRYAPPGGVIRWRWRRGKPGCLVRHESLEDWLETLILEHERGQSPLAMITSPGCPRELDIDWLDKIGPPPPSAEPSALERAFALLQGEGRPLLDLAAQGPPELAVLSDFLHDHSLPVGRATLATLTKRLAPLLEVLP